MQTTRTTIENTLNVTVYRQGKDRNHLIVIGNNF